MQRMVSIERVVVGLIAALAAVPAFAAFPLDVDLSFGRGMPMRDWLLMGSLVLLAVAVALRLMRRRTSTGTGLDVDAPDLRWWRNS